mgnify:FL=1
MRMPPKLKNSIKFLLYSPLNQGLKPEKADSICSNYIVFTLQSIKSRIETVSDRFKIERTCRFLLYSPLNQGLKREMQKIIGIQR